MISMLKNYFEEFKVLKEVKKDFWFVNAIQFFDGLAYFSMIIVITLYLTKNIGMDDVNSGFWVGVFTLMVSVFIMMVGSICDAIGIKRSYILGFAVLVVTRLGLGVIPIFLSGDILKLATQILLVAMAFGTSMIIPVTSTGVRRFTTKKARPTGFNMYYLIMNIGAILAGLAVQYFRDTFGEVASNMYILDFGFATSLICIILAIMINDENYAEEDERIEKTEKKRSPIKIFMEVWKEKPFQKLMLFLFLTLGVRLVFTHQFLVMPKYYTRVAYNDVSIGIVNMINPAVIVLGLIIIIPIINKYDTLKLIIAGMFISALSLLPMALPFEWMLHLPFINNLNEAFWFIIITQIFIFAIGELLFSPRFVEYTASVAPKDKVGSYMGLSVLPMFIAKPLNGLLSGILIAHYCYPGIRAKIDTGEVPFLESPSFMWFIYFAIAATSPIAVMVLKKFLTSSNPAADTPEEAEAEAEDQLAEETN